MPDLVRYGSFRPAPPNENPDYKPMNDEAKALLDEVLEAHPVLVRISAAKRLRDAAESGARRAGEGRVTTDFVTRARAALMDGQPA